MKTSFLLSLAALAGAGFALGQATTTPVGYSTVTVPANSDTTFAPSLSLAPLLQTSSTGISGNQISVAATGAADNSFINSGGDLNAKTYVLVRSGALVGLRFPVSGNTGTTITVVGGATTLQAQGFLSGDAISVIPYWTLATLFPGGAGVGVSDDIYNPVAYVLLSEQQAIGVNRSSAASYFYSDGTGASFGPGWYNANDPEGALQNTVAIDPAITHKIRASAAKTLTITGEVPTTPLATIMLRAATPNDEYVSAAFPVDTTLAASGLQSVVRATDDIYNPIDYVMVYNDGASGFNKSSSAAYFYSDGTSGSYGAGWLDANNPEGPIVTGAVLKAGRCFTVRFSPGAVSNVRWTAPMPYTLNP